MPVDRSNHRRGVVEDSEEGAESEVMKRSVYSDPPSTIAHRSTPAEKHLPAPVTTTGPSRCPIVATTASSNSMSRAFTGGRSNRTVATPSTTSTQECCNFSELTSSLRFDRGVVRRIVDRGNKVGE